MPKLRLFIVSICAEHALSACGVLAIRANCVVPEQTMTEYPYIVEGLLQNDQAVGVAQLFDDIVPGIVRIPSPTTVKRRRD
jgi:hypothetical protein